jgi:hypothetical protein
MRIGYSMLLGEHIDADAIDYDDCKVFQIVCPACREPIFKVERHHPPPIRHYLSHYEKSKAFTMDCELRVEQISSAERSTDNAASRGQKLQYFLLVLREEILSSEFIDPEKSRKTIGKMMSGPGVQILRDLFRRNLVDNNELSDPSRLTVLFDEYLKDIAEVGGQLPATGFAVATQKRIATDVWLHLLSGNATGNFTFLFCAGYLVLSGRIEAARKQRDLFGYEQKFLEFMVRLISATRQTAEHLIREMASKKIGPPHAISGSSYIAKLAAEICHEMVGILLRLPYFDMLRRRNATTTGGVVKKAS